MGQNSKIRSFLAKKIKKKPLTEGQSPPQELEVGPRSGPYLLVQIKPIKLQAKIGLDSGQVVVLKKCFDAFSTEEGTINCDTIGSILSMMGMKVGSRQFIPS